MMHKFILILLLIAFTLSNIQAQTSAETRKRQYNLDQSGLALSGYDPVTYFAKQKAVEGKKDITLLNEGVTYRFANTQDRDLFKANPAKYEPQYGGWCAFAMGDNGKKVLVDPETFKLVNGKLYLFYNKFFNNTKKSWDKDESNLKTKADANWNKFLQN